MSTITVPATATPGQTVTVDGAGFDPKVKFSLSTVDATGLEVGLGSNTNRPRPDGTFKVGINVPPLAGASKVRAYQGSTLVAEAPVLVAPPGPPAFLSRPASGLIVRDGGSVTISNVTIRGGSLNAPAGIGITVRNATSVTITDVDLVDLIGGIYLYNCTGPLLVENVRSRNIGDGTIGAGHSNHIQLAECSVTGAIRGCQFLAGRTEDMLSTWHSGGRGAGAELVIENNHLQGLVTDTATARAWTRGSGTGIIVSDGGGSTKNGWIIVRNNTLLTPGQVGIQHIDGPGLQTYGNVIYGEVHPGNNNPMTSWEGNPRGVVHDNRYWWTNQDGSHPSPWFSGYGSLVATNNVSDSTIDPNALRVIL